MSHFRTQSLKCKCVVLVFRSAGDSRGPSWLPGACRRRIWSEFSPQPITRLQTSTQSNTKRAHLVPFDGPKNFKVHKLGLNLYTAVVFFTGTYFCCSKLCFHASSSRKCRNWRGIGQPRRKNAAMRRAVNRGLNSAVLQSTIEKKQQKSTGESNNLSPTLMNVFTRVLAASTFSPSSSIAV